MPGFRQQDFDLWHMAARAILHGQDPYKTFQDPLGRPVFFYPITQPLFFIPSLALPSTIAGPVFVGGSCGLLAFVISRDAWWPLLIFLSGSIYASVLVAQLSPLLTVAAAVPQLAWLGLLKPNVGLAILAYRPSWRTAAAMLGLTLLSLPVMPRWPQEWIATSTSSTFHFSALGSPGGFLLLAAWLRWRRPEARLLGVLAMVPSSPMVYEVLPLFLVPRKKAELMLLVILSDIALLAVLGLSSQLQTELFFGRARWTIVWLAYIPAMLMILARPNQGEVPAWMETGVAKLPTWLRGRSSPKTGFPSANLP